MDGDVNADVNAGKCFVADGDAGLAQWLMVDLGETAAVYMITIYNRDGGATGSSKCFIIQPPETVSYIYL